MQRTQRSRPCRIVPVGLLTLCLGFAAGWLSLLAPSVEARPTGPRATDRQIALAVSMLMQKQHMSGHLLDDEISERCLKTFIKGLDPYKLYFYQSDIDEFMADRDRLDDQLRSGDIQFAHRVFTRFLARVEERMAVAQAKLDEPHDFTLEEEMVREFDAASYPRTPAEADERWRKRVKFDLLREIADGVEMDEAKKKLRKRYTSFRKNREQTDNDELLEVYLSSMTAGFDPHSSYMSPSTLRNFQIQMSLELDGIGASLRSVDGYTEVHEIIAGGAADREGSLKKGDRIIGVGQGTDGEIEDIVDEKLNSVVEKIRGKRGTIVRLEVNPVENPIERVVYTITRDRIELKNSEARGEVIEFGEKADGTPYRIGVILLPSFYMDMDGARLHLPNYKSTTRDVRRLLDGFNREKVDAVLVDLRFNGGGSLTEAVNMTGLFIDEGPVVQVKGPDGRTQPYDDEEDGMVWAGPLVVLTNQFSASASEIFAGAIQDYGRGIVVGDHATHGKGTVQQLFDVGNVIFRIVNRPELGALKLTIQQFYRPGGDSTQNRGVVSDIELPSLTTHLEVGESDLDYAMEFNHVDPLEFDNYRMVSPQAINELRSASARRISESEFFAREARRIKQYQKQVSRSTITLNKEEFLAQRAELNAEKEEENMYERLSDQDRPVFELDDYGKEVLNVTVDYLRMFGANGLEVAQSAGEAQSARIP